MNLSFHHIFMQEEKFFMTMQNRGIMFSHQEVQRFTEQRRALDYRYHQLTEVLLY